MNSAFAETRDMEEKFSWEPNVDVGETMTAYIIVAELAGVGLHGVKITGTLNTITVDATASAEGCDRWPRILLEERSKGRCHRVFTLPEDADIRRRRVGLYRGLLTIRIPKQLRAVNMAIPNRLVPPAKEHRDCKPMADGAAVAETKEMRPARKRSA